VQNGARTRVFDNDIFENNGDNFAPAGNTVAMVPPGTGFVALAAHEVEVFGNAISNNMTSQVGIISYQITLTAYDDPDYVPYADTLYFHDNTFEGGGDGPAGLLGALLDEVSTSLELPAVPDIVVDGNFDPTKLGDTGELLPEFAICIGDNPGADFLDLGYDGVSFDTLAPTVDAAPYDCAHDPLPPVELDGVPL
jgi:hypothetical protein